MPSSSGKKIKKRPSSCRLSSFGAQVSLKGARLLPEEARRDLMVGISLLAYKFRGEDQKNNVFGAKSEAQSWRSSCFLSWNEISLTLGGQKQAFWGSQAPKCTLVAQGLLFSFGAQSSLGGMILAWVGTSSDMGARPQNAPVAPGQRTRRVLLCLCPFSNLRERSFRLSLFISQ